MTFKEFLTRAFTFDRADAVAQELRDVQDEYYGQEVIENTGRGYSVAIITRVEFDSSVYDRKAQAWGANLYTIRYIADGSQVTVGSDVLTLTGVKYQNIDEVRPLMNINTIVWS